MTAAIQSLDRTRLVDFSQLSHREYSAEKGVTALLLMPSNLEITQAGDRLREESVSPTETVLDLAPPVVDAPARLDETGVELIRGAFLNTIAMLASNFRGMFTFRDARSRSVSHQYRHLTWDEGDAARHLLARDDRTNCNNARVPACTCRRLQGVLTGSGCNRRDRSIRTYCTRARLNIVSTRSPAEGSCLAFRRSTLPARICCSHQHLSAD